MRAILNGVIVASLLGTAAAAAERPRNVILFVPDGMRAGMVTPENTPALAALRDQGVNLANSRDYVQQTNFVQCVGTSIQMMLNIMGPGADRTARTQRRLQNLARAWSGPRPDGFQRRGASVRGWAASGLTTCWPARARAAGCGWPWWATSGRSLPRRGTGWGCRPAPAWCTSPPVS